MIEWDESKQPYYTGQFVEIVNPGSPLHGRRGMIFKIVGMRDVIVAYVSLDIDTRPVCRIEETAIVELQFLKVIDEETKAEDDNQDR